MDKIKFEILSYSYWEHIKTEKDLARIFGPTDKRRIEINEAANEILKKLNSEPEDERSVATMPNSKENDGKING